MSTHHIESSQSVQLDIHAILKLLPHRYPFLMIDKVLSFEAEKSLIAIKNITANEFCFTGHFPENPIFPGVLILEALAQASGILFLKTNEHRGGLNINQKYVYLFIGIEKARFRRVVRPGDQLKLEINLLRDKQGFAVFEGIASVDGEIACRAKLSSARKEVGA